MSSRSAEYFTVLPHFRTLVFPAKGRKLMAGALMAKAELWGQYGTSSCNRGCDDRRRNDSRESENSFLPLNPTHTQCPAAEVFHLAALT